MLPVFPYNGILRPVLMLVGMGLTFFALYRTQQRPYYKRLLIIACLGYAFFLLYATFLSRSVAQYYSYRLELMWSLKNTFSLNGEPESLLFSRFSTICLDNPEMLEAIVINLLLMVPVGYLLPLVAAVRSKAVRGWQIIISGFMLSVLIEVIQLVTRLGMLDVDDVVFNTTGTAIGYTLYRYIFNKTKC